MIDRDLLASHNEARRADLEADAEHALRQLRRRGIDGERVIAALSVLEIALPSWGVGTGGTRFARFPGPGEPRNLHEKLDDCAVIQQLTRITPRVSLHLPWDRADDYVELRSSAAARGLGFDAINSNTFQDPPGQALSYKFGSLTHVDADVRALAVAHNVDCVRVGEQLGSSALTVWIGDGTNFPGQQDFTASFERYLESLSKIYAALPPAWSMYLEHKLYEPAFYSTVNQDWGSSLIAAQATGERCRCLVDLGHHAPTVNIEMIVARLAFAGRLGGFHFNDSKYGDDDLDTGSINPYQLFLVFHELVGAHARGGAACRPAYMLDQSHNVTDPVESLMSSAEAVALAYAQALVVDRDALEDAQRQNDALRASRQLQGAFRTDVRPLVATARLSAGGAIDPIAAFRESGYRAAKARERPAAAKAAAGIV